MANAELFTTISYILILLCPLLPDLCMIKWCSYQVFCICLLVSDLSKLPLQLRPAPDTQRFYKARRQYSSIPRFLGVVDYCQGCRRDKRPERSFYPGRRQRGQHTFSGIGSNLRKLFNKIIFSQKVTKITF